MVFKIYSQISRVHRPGQIQVILGICFQKIWTRKNNLSILISSVGMVQKFDGKVKCEMKNAPSNNQRHILLVFSFFWNFQITYILQWCACFFLRNLNQRTSWTHLRNCSTLKNATPHHNPVAWSPFSPSVIPRAHYTQAHRHKSLLLRQQMRAFQTAYDTLCHTSFSHPADPGLIYLSGWWLYSCW